MWTWVDSSFSKGSSVAATSATSSLPSYPKLGLQLLSSFGIGDPGMKTVVAAGKKLLGTGKKQELMAGAATYPHHC